jgi:hypothetical protein
MEQNSRKELFVLFHFEHAFRLKWLEVIVDLQDGDARDWVVVPLVDGLPLPQSVKLRYDDVKNIVEGPEDDLKVGVTVLVFLNRIKAEPPSCLPLPEPMPFSGEFKELFCQGILCDVTLDCGAMSIQAHK